MPGQQSEDPIVEVWASNVEAEFKKIRKIVKQYSYVSMVSLHNYSIKVSSKFALVLFMIFFPGH